MSDGRLINKLNKSNSFIYSFYPAGPTQKCPKFSGLANFEKSVYILMESQNMASFFFLKITPINGVGVLRFWGGTPAKVPSKQVEYPQMTLVILNHEYKEIERTSKLFKYLFSFTNC